MIYIKNTTEIQTVFIPRNELQKEAYITSTKTYEDGYREGLEDGKEQQKEQLLNLYVTENGQYEREDGWGTVTVDIPIGECPEGGSCNLGEGEVLLDTTMAGTYELYASDDGYDGWSKFYVTLENGGAIKVHRAEELIQMFNEGWGIDFGTYYYVGGKITEVQEINTQYGNATYVLDNGFKVYRGDWIDGNPFGEDQIKVGAYIVVYGIIQDYKGQLQFKAHSQVIAYQECEGGEITCNLIKETFTVRNDVEQFLASDYGADGFESVYIDAYDYGKQKFNEGYEEGINQGGTVTTYPTIREVYNTEDVTVQVSFKGTVAVCLTNEPTYYMIVTDHTGSIYVTATQPYDVGDECFFAGVVRKTTSTNMRYMSNPIIEVLSKGNYVVMPTDAVELTNKDELYVPNEYGNAEMKYLYYQGEVQKIASNGNITILTPESVSAKGQITLRAAKEEWRSNLFVGDYIRMYMFTTNGDGYFIPTDIIKLGTEGGSCNLEDKWVYPSMADRDGNGYIVVDQSEGYDGLDRVVIDPTTIYNEGVSAGKAEGGDLKIDAVTTSLGAGKGYNWTRAASQFGLDGMSEITIDGSQYQEWTKAHTLLQAYQNTEEAYITENGEYRANIGYDGYALNGYNVGWVIDVIPTIDTDVEIWVKPYDGAPNMWQGYIGSQASDDDNTTFQIRKMDGSNTFSFRFGNMEFEYGFEYERWYRLRMNRNGIWVNGEQVCGWDVQVFEENPNPLMINGIYNLGFESENYRMNHASYGYVYFHNTDSLLVPFNNGLFIGNKNQIIERPAADGATLRLERNWYPKGYTKVIVDVPQNGGGNCDDAYNNGYNQGYNDGQANCGGGSANLINPIIFSETEGNTINAEGVQIPTFVYEGNQHYNVWALNMAEYEEFKIQIRFQPSNGGYEDPVNIFGCEDTDWDNTTFGARIYQGQIYFRMSGLDVEYPYSDYAWYDVEMGYNSSKRWITVNGETLLETDHAFVNKPNQNFMIGAINSGGNAFRPFYGKIAATYIEENGNQVWLLPKEDGHMDIYWNDRSSPWVSISGENNARFESDWMSGDGMKTITWFGKRVTCPSVQDEALLYDTIAFSYTVDGWRNHNIIRDNITNDCDDRPLDCLLLRNRYGECTVMTKLDICSGTARLENGWNGGSIIYSLKSNTITKFSNSSINSYHLKSIDTGFAQLEENAILNCNNLTDIKVTILNNDLSYQFATNCFNGLPTEGTITIKKNGSVVTLTDDEITSFFRTIVGEGWTITIE